MAQIEADVLVVGGGLVGTTLAAALGGAGVAVVLVERADPADLAAVGFDGRVSAIALGSANLLGAIGVWERVAEAEPIRDIRVSDGDARGRASRLFLHYDHRELGDRPFGYMVENRVLRAALYARLAELGAVRVLAPVAVDALERGPRRVEARLADGRRVVARLAVGADGRRSALRRRAGIGVITWPYAQTSIVCTVAHQRPHNGVAHEHFLPGGPFAVLPMTGRRSAVVWTESNRLAPHMLALGEPEFGGEMTRRFGDSLGRLRPVGPRWSYPLSLLHAERYIDRRLALIGDAAHAIHPIAGQGLNLGFRDVAALAEAVVDARRLGLDIGEVPVLQRYQRWRRFDTLLLAAVTDGLNRLFSNDLTPVRLIRDLGLGAVNRAAPLKRFFTRHAMGLVGELPRLVRGEPL
ncbi:MAG: UbiH/UbiF/VisC/COQ6 family ubiquinone biosynthesis hydroxylase [Kiloniellales bacterium]